jgi:copper chaperone
MAEHNYKFNITMTCGGCSGAVERVLKKLEGKSKQTTRNSSRSLSPCSYILFTDKPSLTGVKEFDVSLDSQTATIKTDESLDYSTVLEKIKKTGKAVNSGEADGVAQAV